MRRALSFFLFSFSFSLGLAGGAVATRPIEEKVPGGQAASNSVTVGGATEESHADPSSYADYPNMMASAKSVERSGAYGLDEHDSAAADPARALTDNDGVPPYGTAEEGVTDAVRRLARVFAQMNPREAAPVLSSLSDAEVRVILMQLAERTVAEILSNMEPERAARLTRLLIRAAEVDRE
jgi:hypothetical protein